MYLCNFFRLQIFLLFFFSTSLTGQSKSTAKISLDLSDLPLWMSTGYGFVKQDHSINLGLSVFHKSILYTLRSSYKGDQTKDLFLDFDFLVGKGWIKERKLFTFFSIGIGLISKSDYISAPFGGYRRPFKISVNFPLESQLFFRFNRNFGLGLNLMLSYNNFEIYSVYNICIIIGRFVKPKKEILEFF